MDPDPKITVTEASNLDAVAMYGCYLGVRGVGVGLGGGGDRVVGAGSDNAAGANLTQNPNQCGNDCGNYLGIERSSRRISG